MHHLLPFWCCIEKYLVNTFRDLFLEYLHHFVKHVNPSLSNKVIIVYDNHASHKSLQAIEFAKENSITQRNKETSGGCIDKPAYVHPVEPASRIALLRRPIWILQQKARSNAGNQQVTARLTDDSRLPVDVALAYHDSEYTTEKLICEDR